MTCNEMMFVTIYSTMMATRCRATSNVVWNEMVLMVDVSVPLNPVKDPRDLLSSFLLILISMKALRIVAL